MLITHSVILNYKNERGFEIDMAPFSSVWLEGCDEEMDNEITSEKQRGLDGETLVSTSMGKRLISLYGYISNRQDYEYWQRFIKRVLNPELMGTLTYINTQSNTTKMIDCHVAKVPMVYWQNGKIRFDIELVCLTPFWREVEITEVIAMLIKHMHFPLVIKNKGFMFGMRKRTLQSEFENIGDVAAGFRCRIVARHGTVLNPSISNLNTGETIKLDYHMAKGDVFEVVNFPHLKRITLNGTTNAFKFLNPEKSDFFLLPVGENSIGYNADMNTVNLEVLVYYTPQTLGV